MLGYRIEKISRTSSSENQILVYVQVVDAHGHLSTVVLLVAAVERLLAKMLI